MHIVNLFTTIFNRVQNGSLFLTGNKCIVTYVYASKSPVLMLSINCSVILMISCRRAGIVNRSINQLVRVEAPGTPVKLTGTFYDTNTVACT